MAAMKRSEIPHEQVWSVESIFADEAAFDAAIQQLNSDITALHQHKDTLTQGEEQLASFLKARDGVLAAMDRIFGYAFLKFSEDGTDAANQALFGRAMRVAQAVEEELTDLRDALMTVPAERLEQYANADGPAATYRLYLTELVANRPHLLDPKAEAALAAMGEALGAPSNWYRTVTGADMRYQPVPDEEGKEFAVSTFGFMFRVETSTDLEFRRRAYESLTNGYRPYHNTLGVSLATEIKRNVAMAKLRGYSSTAEMLLNAGDATGRPSDSVPVSFFERVPGVILKELAPHMQRYARLRSRVWGIDKLSFADTKAPVLKDANRRVTWDEVQHLISSSVEVMGSEYKGIVERAFRERWIYRGENIGNLQGAYCDWIPDVHAYVFAPFHGIAYDMFMTTHELGHAVHGTYAYANQVQQNRSSSRLFVEAPSTFNEHLLAHYLRQTGGEETRLQTNCLQLFTFHHNFVTHLIEGELLRRLYLLADAGEPITASVLDRVQLEILGEFWGDTVELDEGAAMTWMRQAHYYSGLYPYTYSVGLTASTVLAQRLAAGEDIAETWINVLKQGGRVHALDLFRQAGIEMDSEQPYKEAVAYVGRLVDELEAGLS